MVSPLSSFGPNPSLFPNTIRLLRKGFTGLPCDAGSLRSPSRERTLSWISINTAATSQSQRLYCKPVLVDSSMGADAHHGPSPKGLLCNAGAGAAAGMLSIFLLSEKLNCKQKRKIEKDMFFVCFGQPCQINRGVWFGRKYLCFTHRLRSYERTNVIRYWLI